MKVVLVVVVFLAGALFGLLAFPHLTDPDNWLFIKEAHAKERLNEGASMQVGCDLAKVDRIDPIAGTTHLHNFYGVRGMNVGTTIDKMLSSPTTCTASWDRSSFWHPAFRDPNGMLSARHISWYFADRHPDSPQKVTVPPQGLELLGNKDFGHIDFRCGTFGQGNDNVPKVPYGCNKEYITARAHFPDCWDGKSIKWDGGAHMKENVRGVCPPGYKRIGEPRFTVRIDNTPKIQAPLEVSMGTGEWMPAQEMFHGDAKFVFKRAGFLEDYKRCVMNGPGPFSVCQNRLGRS